MRATLFTSTAVFLLGAVGTIASANVLTDPGFESNPIGPSFVTALGNFPTYQNQWAPENGAIVGVTGGITPAAGTKQLELQGPGTGTVSQAGQIVDISSYAALVDAGNAVVQAGALLNSNAQSAIGGVYINYFSGNNFGTMFGPSPNNVLNPLDSLSSTWQSASFSAPIPPGTRWIVFQAAFDANSISNSAGITTAGFVDNAYVNIVAVPEPASCLLFSLGAVGIFIAARRRRNA